MASFDRKATDRKRSEKKQFASKGEAKLKPVAKVKYKNRLEFD